MPDNDPIADAARLLRQVADMLLDRDDPPLIAGDCRKTADTLEAESQSLKHPVRCANCGQRLPAGGLAGGELDHGEHVCSTWCEKELLERGCPQEVEGGYRTAEWYGRTLEAEVMRLRGVIERDRTHVAGALSRIKGAIASRHWLREPGRGCYAWDDERYQAEFGEALDEIEAALGPLAVLAVDLSDSQVDPKEVAEARGQGRSETERLQAKIAELEDALKPLADVGGYIKRCYSSPVYRDAGLWVPSSTAEPEPPRLMYRDAIRAARILGEAGEALAALGEADAES